MTQNQPKQKPTLALIIPSLSSGGAERVFSNIANHLSGNYNLHIITLYKDVIFYKLDKNIPITYCEEKYRPNASRLEAILIHFKLMRSLKHKIISLNADLIFSFTTTANFYSVLLSKFLNIPSIISERVHPEHALNKPWKWLIKRSYKFTNKLVVQTEDIKQYFSPYVPISKIALIENPLSEKLIKNKDCTKERHHTILSIGRLEHQKNQGLLIKAFGKINAKDWKLILLGKGSQLEAYKKLTLELKIEKQVSFLGTIEDISPFLNREGIFVMTSNFEGSPNALIEAMYFDMPCISTNCPSGPSELITSGQNGILIPMNDEESLVQALSELISSPLKRTEIGQAAGQSVDRFKPEIALKKWENLIESTLKPQI